MLPDYDDHSDYRAELFPLYLSMLLSRMIVHVSQTCIRTVLCITVAVIYTLIKIQAIKIGRVARKVAKIL